MAYENATETFGLRLRQARIKARLSMEGLCEKMKGAVTKQAISKYEGGKMMAGSETLQALAAALGVDIDYFFRPFTFDLRTFEVSFRKKSSVGAKEVAALKVQIQDEIERYLEIEEIVGAECHLPERIDTGIITTRQDIEQCARRIRQEWRLGTDCIANVPNMLEAHGIKVIYTDAAEGFDGVSGVVNGTHYIIVLNANKKHIERRRLTAVHELGHLLFNEALGYGLTGREKERLCNAFASELLLPEERIMQYFGGKPKIEFKEVIALGEAYGISADAIVHKMHDMDIVSEKRYRGYCIRKNKNARLKEWLERSRYTELSANRLETMVYSALAQQLISTTRAASLLGCTVDKVCNSLNVI